MLIIGDVSLWLVIDFLLEFIMQLQNLGVLAQNFLHKVHRVSPKVVEEFELVQSLSGLFIAGILHVV